MDSFQTFLKHGFATFQAEKPEILTELRDKIFQKAKTLVKYKGEKAEDFLNKFHDYKLSSAELNTVRMEMVDFCTKSLKVNEMILDAFGNSLSGLVGPDVAAQRTVNLVIQQPGDADQVPIHRDAPSNSHFEVIVWLPLVHVYGTKSMFVSNKERSSKGLAMLKGGKTYGDFSQFIKENSEDLDVKFGAAAFFAAGLAHGCKVNVENETRWSLNMRFKNLFSPYGSKGLPEFFEVLRLSPLSRIGFDFEKQEFGGS